MALVTNNIGTGETYTTIATWMAALPTMGTDIWHGVLTENKNYNEEVDLVDPGDNTSITSYIWLDVASGVRHDGTSGSGARISLGTPTQGSVIRAGSDYTRVTGLEIHLTGGTGSEEGIEIAPGTGGSSDGILVEDCIIWHDAGVADSDGIYGGNDNTEVTVVNSVFQGWERGAIHMQNSSASTRFYTVNAYHCSFIDGASDTEGGGAFVADCPNASSTQDWNIYNCVSPEAAGGTAEGEVFVVSDNTGTVTWDGDNNLVGKTTAQAGTDTMAGNILLDYVTGFELATGNNWIVRDPVLSGLRDVTTAFRAANGNAVTGAALDQQGTLTDTRADLSADILGNARPTTSPDIGPWHNPTVTMSQPSIRDSQLTTSTGQVTSFNVTLPTTVSSGDLLLVALGTGSGDSISTPTDWTSVENSDIGGGPGTHVVARVSDGTEGGTTINFTWSGGSGAAAWAGSIQDWDGTISNLVSANNTGTSVTGIGLGAALANPSDSSAFFAFVGHDSAGGVTLDHMRFGFALLDEAEGTGSLASIEGGIGVYVSGAYAVDNTRASETEFIVSGFPDVTLPYVLVPKAPAGGNPPNTPSITTPAESAVVSSPVDFVITYSDPDGDPQAKVSIRREVSI